MVDGQEKGWISNEQEAKRAQKLARKSEEGELTPEEKGQLGAYRSRQATKGDPASEHETRSWTKGDDTRAPTLSEDATEEAEEIRAKQARGETLTRHEAGVLGGVARAEEAQE